MPAADRPSPLPADANPVAELIRQIHAGSEEAARLLYQQYEAYLLLIIRKNFLPAASPLRRLMDSKDLVQEAWDEVFALIRAGKRFESQEHFTNFLVTVTANRFRKQFRTFRTAKRSLTREQPLDLSLHDLATPEPGPAQQAADTDEYAKLLADAPEDCRLLLLALRDGSRIPEVAEKMGICVRSVQRMLQMVRRHWLRRLNEPGTQPG